MTINPAKLRRAAEELLQNEDVKKMTLKDIRNQLEQSLGLQNGHLHQIKDQVKAMIIEILSNKISTSSSNNEEKGDGSDDESKESENVVEEEEEDDDDDDDDHKEEEEEVDTKSRRRKIITSKSTPKKQTKGSTTKRKRETSPKRENTKKSKTSSYKGIRDEINSPADTILQQFKAYISAAAVGPSIYRGTKELTKKKQINLLFERLKDLGHKLDSPPTKAQIAAAKRSTKKKQQLDGIDTSLIIDSPRRTRRQVKVVSYAEKKGSDDEEAQSDVNDDDDDDDDDDDEEVEFNDNET